MPPLARWRDGLSHPLALPDPAALREAFLWSATRTVTKTATVSLHNNTYQVDPVLVGRKVELVFDPFDLADVEVRHRDRSHGPAAPFHIGRHAHPKARPEHVTDDLPPAPTGIDYLRLIDTIHDQQIADRVNYTAIHDSTGNHDSTATRPEQHP